MCGEPSKRTGWPRFDEVDQQVPSVQENKPKELIWISLNIFFGYLNMSFTVGKNFWEMKKPWNEFELDFVSLKRSLSRSRASAESSYSTLVPCWNMLVHWSLLVEKRFSNIFEEQGQRDFIEINNKIIIIMVARTAGREWSGPWSGFFVPDFFVRSVVRIFRSGFHWSGPCPDFWSG